MVRIFLGFFLFCSIWCIQTLTVAQETPSAGEPASVEEAITNGMQEAADAPDVDETTDEDVAEETDEVEFDEGAVIASAYIEGTEGNEDIFGEATFIETPEGVSVQAEVYNVAQGKHGFHIHEFGSCDNKGEAAGSHYNPLNTPHGHSQKDGTDKAHLGDMGNIEVDMKGEGFVTTFLPGATITGDQNSILGKAIILHEKEDDFGQPTGNAGARIACGLIELIE